MVVSKGKLGSKFVPVITGIVEVDGEHTIINLEFVLLARTNFRYYFWILVFEFATLAHQIWYREIIFGFLV